MDYKQHYGRLIDNAKQGHFEGYTEKHHIVPRCMGGSNSKANIICLSAEAHFMAHKLLMKMHPKSFGLMSAVFFMSSCNRFIEGRVNNKIFGWLRRRMSEKMKGRTVTEETRQKARAASTGQTHTAETRKKIGDFHRGIPRTQEVVEKLRGQKRNETTRAKMRGRIVSEETRKIIGAFHKGKVISEETRAKMSEGQKNRFRQYIKSDSKNPRSPLTQEHRDKLRISALNRKPISDETRLKMRESAKKRARPLGDQ